MIGPTEQEVKDAIFGVWDFASQRRRPGLLDRIRRIEIILGLAVPVLVARALGVPTEFLGKFFADHGLASSVTQHAIAFLAGFPK